MFSTFHQKIKNLSWSEQLIVKWAGFALCFCGPMAFVWESPDDPASFRFVIGGLAAGLIWLFYVQLSNKNT
jgi:hypothetical protein